MQTRLQTGRLWRLGSEQQDSSDAASSIQVQHAALHLLGKWPERHGDEKPELCAPLAGD